MAEAIHTRSIVLLALPLAAAPGEAAAQQSGHRLLPTEVLVDSREHWRNWEFPAGTVEISEAGRVRPRRLQKDTRAASGIVELLRLDDAFKDRDPDGITLRDAVAAGSNAADGAAVLDGDPRTYWEPERQPGQDAVPENWWLTVDLGELAFVRKVALRFADEELGDPFLLFDVLLSDGRPPPGSRDKELMRFRPVLRTLVPNKTQREFEIDFGEVPEVGAELARFVKVAVTGSDLERGREVAGESYDALAAEDRGAVEYYKRQPDGTAIAVDREVYDQLEAGRRGEVRYYRRERPRLAELQVRKQGDNVMRGALDRGGSVTSSAANLSGGLLLDGSVETFSFFEFSRPGMELLFDLGAHFWIDTHRVIYNILASAASSSFPSYRLDVSDGSRAPDGTLSWRTVVDRQQVPAGGVSVEGNSFPAVNARYFRTRWLDQGGASNLAEIQLFGQGYQPQVRLESDLVRLGGRRNLLSIEWEGAVPERTRLAVQTRTGNELDQIHRYFDKNGNEVTRQFYYEKLKSFTRGDSIPVQVPGSDWSGWSEPYRDQGGSPVTSPSPREFLKIRATLLSDDPDTSAVLESIRLRFGDPVAQGLTGEIEPSSIDSVGVERPFSLYLRPRFGRGDPGFDELLLAAPAGMSLTFAGLHAGSETDLAPVDEAVLVSTSGDSLHLRFPAVGPGTDIEILRLDFITALYSSGAVLRPALQNSEVGPGVWQRVDAGDALPGVGGNTVTLVAGAADSRLLADASVKPPVMTPNGDGVNEGASFLFKVLRVGDDSPVEVTIFDLGGRMVKRIVERRERSAGRYEIRWDGTDASGALVAPGTYVARLRIDTETDGASAGDKEKLLTVGVAY